MYTEEYVPWGGVVDLCTVISPCNRFDGQHGLVNSLLFYFFFFLGIEIYYIYILFKIIYFKNLS
jgi:hypothetical protein